MISFVIGFVSGFGSTLAVGLVIYWFKYIKKKDLSYLLEFDREELTSK